MPFFRWVGNWGHWGKCSWPLVAPGVTFNKALYFNVYLSRYAIRAIKSPHGPVLRNACKYSISPVHNHVPGAWLFCPWWKWLHASLIQLHTSIFPATTFNIEIPQSEPRYSCITIPHLTLGATLYFNQRRTEGMEGGGGGTNGPRHHAGPAHSST